MGGGKSAWVGSSVVAGFARTTLREAIAFAVHLEDVDVVGQPVEERAGKPLGAESLGPFIEGQITGDQRGTALVSWCCPKMDIRVSLYPQLRQLCWNRLEDGVMDGEAALAIYERNWLFVDTEAMTTEVIGAGAVGLSSAGISISTGRKTPSRVMLSSGDGPPSAGANRGSFSHLKVRFAFIE